MSIDFDTLAPRRLCTTMVARRSRMSCLRPSSGGPGPCSGTGSPKRSRLQPSCWTCSTCPCLAKKSEFKIRIFIWIICTCLWEMSWIWRSSPRRSPSRCTSWAGTFFKIHFSIILFYFSFYVKPVIPVEWSVLGDVEAGELRVPQKLE